jgi:hypothetical protein
VRLIAAPLLAERLRSLEHESEATHVQGAVEKCRLGLNDEFDDPVYQLKLLRSAGRE